jgi:hypothetical protein
MPGLSAACGSALAEAAAVCLEHQNHQAGVTLRLRGMKSHTVQLAWPSVDDQKRRSHNDLQEATEYGAMGVAILVTREVTGLVVIERAKKGPGFDYWLGSSDDSLFQPKARLEVSGILAEDDSIVTARVNQKKRQIAPSDSIATGYVAVVGFRGPVAHVESK